LIPFENNKLKVFSLSIIYSLFLEQIIYSPISINTKWKQHGVTIAGENGQGNQLTQLSHPKGIYVDNDNRCIYLADSLNHRIVQWKSDANMGEVVAGGNGVGNRMNQLNDTKDVVVDKKTDSLIICDQGNRRVMRWSCHNGINGQTIISDIDCYGLAMDSLGDLYVSDWKKNEVGRWKIGETNRTIVAGGNGGGNQLNQLNSSCFLFIDEDHSVYVSDQYNNRVMKWVKGAKEGIVVAGGQGYRSSLTQLSYPQGVIVDHLGNIYVADCFNHRIMCWSKGSKEVRVIVGGNGPGQQSNQMLYPRGISFDRQGHLYVVDGWNHRVQRFEIDLN
jgi:sugar lactone lactonase YvrE